MADFINRTDLTQYVRSGNTPEFSDPPWLEVVPGSGNATLVATVPGKYLKISGDVLSEMTQPEKDAVDAAELATSISDKKAGLKSDVDAASPVGVDVRALIQNSNRRINYLTNRVIELQEDLQAIKASNGPADNIRAAIRASYLATQTRALPAAIADYKDDVDDSGVSG